MAREAPALPDSDESLLDRFRGGDEAAYARLVDRHASGVVAYATRLVGDADAAEDLAQEAFFRLYSRSRNDPPPRVVAWLLRVVRNAGLDLLRSRRRAPGPLETEPAVTDAGPSGLESAELDARIRASIAALPDDFREPFELCVLQGLSYDDAALVLGCPAKTVSSRIARARERLRAAVGALVEPSLRGVKEQAPSPPPPRGGTS